MHNQNPIITIIMPVYNSEQYLTKTLNSLLGQTLSDIEIICVNDGSSDNSLALLETFAMQDNRIKVFSQKNAGPAAARNIGLDKAKGKYIMFCDSDDWYEPDMCQKMVETIEKYDVDFVMCDCNVVDIGEKHGRSTGDVDYLRLKQHGEISLGVAQKLEVNVLLWNKILKADYIKRYGITFPVGHDSEDDSFIFQYLAVSSKMYGLDLQLYNYVLLEGSITGQYFAGKKREKLHDRFYALLHTCKMYEQNNLLVGMRSFVFRRLSGYLNLLWPQYRTLPEKMKALNLSVEIINMFSNKSGLSRALRLAYAGKTEKSLLFLDKKCARTRRVCGVKIVKGGGIKEYSIGKFSIYKREKQGKKRIYCLFGRQIGKRK